MEQKLHTLYSKTEEGISIDRVQREYEFNMPSRHYHEEYEIYYLIDGERYYFIEKNTYLIHSPSIVFVPKRKIHKTAGAGSAYHDRVLLSIKEEPFGSFLASLGSMTLADIFSQICPVIELSTNENKIVSSMMEHIVSELTDKKDNYAFLVWTMLAQLLLLALRKKTNPVDASSNTCVTTLKHKKVDEVAAYILQHCTANCSLDFLAQHFYVSKSYLCRIFKDVTGFTVIEYQNIQRIRLAYPMLLETSLKISEIAEELGYESVTYFERVFRIHTGISPLNYRKQRPSITTV